MSELRAWVRWEFGRRVEVTPFVVVIIADRLVKGTALLLGGIGLLVLAAHTDLHALAENAQRELNLGGGRSLWRRLLEQVLAKFGTHADPIALGALTYAVLEFVEAAGLLRRRRWAEYLVLLATIAFLPLEIDELIRHPSPLKGAVLVLNIAIAGYLIYRKRLFLERPGSTAPAGP